VDLSYWCVIFSIIVAFVFRAADAVPENTVIYKVKSWNLLNISVLDENTELEVEAFVIGKVGLSFFFVVDKTEEPAEKSET